MRSILMMLMVLGGWASAVAGDGSPPSIELPRPADPATVERVLASAAELCGLYRFDELRATMAEDGTIPVYRLMEQAAGD
jgi:hypothetical protein